jgi:hypothetical protein
MYCLHYILTVATITITFINATVVAIANTPQNGEVVAAATHIHVENAGVHSGDATLILPPGPEDLSTYSFHRVQAATAALAKALQVSVSFYT